MELRCFLDEEWPREKSVIIFDGSSSGGRLILL